MSAHIQHYAKTPWIYWRGKLLQEMSAFNLQTSLSTGKTITITSYVPSTGIEWSPEIGKIETILSYFADQAVHYSVRLIDQKISGSVNKETYQLLTFMVLDEKIAGPECTELARENMDRKYDKLILLIMPMFEKVNAKGKFLKQ